jgi:hypothetical protein
LSVKSRSSTPKLRLRGRRQGLPLRLEADWHPRSDIRRDSRELTQDVLDVPVSLTSAVGAIFSLSQTILNRPCFSDNSEPIEVRFFWGLSAESHLHSHTVVFSSMTIDIGSMSVPSCEPSQNGRVIERPHEHHQYSPGSSSARLRSYTTVRTWGSCAKRSF